MPSTLYVIYRHGLFKWMEESTCKILALLTGINKPCWEITLKGQISPSFSSALPDRHFLLTPVPGHWAVWNFQRRKHVNSPCLWRWGCTEAYCLQAHWMLCGERGVSSSAAWSLSPQHCFFLSGMKYSTSSLRVALCSSRVRGAQTQTGKWSLHRQPNKSEAASEDVARTGSLNGCFVQKLVAVAGEAPSFCHSPGAGTKQPFRSWDPWQILCRWSTCFPALQWPRDYISSWHFLWVAIRVRSPSRIVGVRVTTAELAQEEMEHLFWGQMGYWNSEGHFFWVTA